MFGLADLLPLIISAFIILPVVILCRESGYLIASHIVGATNTRLTLGSGPSIAKFNFLNLGEIDIRKHYHLYSWFSFDELKRESERAYIFLYSSPIMSNVVLGLTLNALLANGYFDEYTTFFNRFVFYIFFYVLFDAVPMRTVNEMPNNGKIIYDMILHGKRTDQNKYNFIPSTAEVDEGIQKEIEEMQEEVEEQKEKKEQAREQKEEAQEQREEEREKKEEIKEIKKTET